MTKRNPEFPSVLAGALLTAALFGLRRAGRGRDDDWRRVWALWAELGSPPLPCTAPWLERRMT